MKTILHWSFWLLAILALGLALKSGKVYAGPFLSMESGGIRIVIYSELCNMKGVIKNLANRATWTENGKTIEGCAGPFQEFQIVMFYFADQTVFPVPFQYFQRISGA